MIIARNILNFITKEKFAFVVFIASSITTLSCFIFIGNYIANLYHDYCKYDESSRSYTIEITNENQFDKLDSFIQEWEDKLQHIYAVIVNEDGELVTADIIGEFPDDIKVQYGRYFYEEDFVNPNYVAIMPNDLYRYNSDTGFDHVRTVTIGDEYYIKGTGFEVIGIGTSEFFQIPFNAIEDYNTIDYMVIATAEVLHANLKNTFCESIAEMFLVDTIQLPSKSASFLSSGYVQDFFLIICLIAAGILNFAFLYSYIWEMRKKQVKVFRLCGCSCTKISIQCVAEVIILVSIAFMVSLLLIKTVLLPLIEGTNFLFCDSLTVPLVLVIYCLSILLFILFFWPAIRKVSKTEPWGL